MEAQGKARTSEPFMLLLYIALYIGTKCIYCIFSVKKLYFYFNVATAALLSRNKLAVITALLESTV